MPALSLPGMEQPAPLPRPAPRRPESRVGLCYAVIEYEWIGWYVAIDGYPVGPFSSKPVMQRYLRMKGLLSPEAIARLWPPKPQN